MSTQLVNARVAHLLPRVDLEREAVEYIWQLGLEILQRSTQLIQHKGLTEYRMTRSLQSMRPVAGQDAGGRGSTNSGGSRSSSEYSLTRSTATLRRTGERWHHQCVINSYHRLFKAYESSNHEQQIHGDRRGEGQGETGKGRVHVREDCDECDTTNDSV